MHFLISNLVGPLDITEAVVMREIDLFHISFRFSPALGEILKDNLNIAVVKPDLSFGAVLLRRPDVAPLDLLGETKSHNKAMIMVFGGTSCLYGHPFSYLKGFQYR